MERSEPDPGAELSGQGGDIGLEEPMWNLGLGGGGAAGGSGGVGGGGDGGESSYPERPGERNCIYYLRTGFCGYGERCRFNHPPDRGVTYEGARTGGGEYPERDGQPVCQYFKRTGSCKFGPSCKYHHPRHEAAPPTAITLNVHGYPIRLGVRECSYYMKTGQCKFGMTCKFHHPQPDNVRVPEATSAGTAAITAPAVYPTTVQPPPTSTQQYGVVAGSWQVARPPMVPSPYIQGPYGPVFLSPGVVPIAGWTPYPASFPAPSSQSTAGACQPYGFPSMSAMTPAYTEPYPPISSFAGSSSSIQNEPYYPERPGQPECQHYLRTGQCKYGPSCRYHHPADWTAQKASFTLTPMGLPLRPGAPTCSYFVQHGICKFGPTCKFNHPMGPLSYSPSASSLSDVPVAPSPVGSTMATLAPSSSSSDLRTEVISGSNNSSSGTVQAKNGSVPESGTQQPGQSSTTQASPSSTGDQGGNIQTSS